jgi:hypothetical protein
LSDTVDTTTAVATETPAQPVRPAEVPPTAGSQRTTGWFGRVWRVGLAAAVIVLVAGVFFTIGWFTSTGGDHGHGMGGREIRQQMNMREWDSEQGGPGQDSGQWGRQRNHDGQSGSDSQPNTQTPSNGQTPSTPQTTSSEQGYLGVGIATVTPALQQQYGLSRATGVLVASIDGTGPAVKAGIQQGDIIISVDGTAVTTQQEGARTLHARGGEERRRQRLGRRRPRWSEPNLPGDAGGTTGHHFRIAPPAWRTRSEPEGSPATQRTRKPRPCGAFFVGAPRRTPA